MQILTITDAAATRLQSLMATAEGAPEAVLLSVSTKGCSGMKYDLQFLPRVADAPAHADRVDVRGMPVFVDPKAAIYLVGTVMDYKEDALQSGFEFINPNETGRCGCGESFTVDKNCPA